jgi:alkylated DNA repair dioxygenase AlkB
MQKNKRERKQESSLELSSAPVGFLYVESFLSSSEEEELFVEVGKLSFDHDVFRGRALNRGYAQFGYRYISTGRRLDTAPALPEFAQVLIAKALPFCPEGSSFNQLLINKYPPGAGIGWHTDAPRFGDCVIAASLGGAARLQFRRSRTSVVVFEARVNSGSLWVMSGEARWNFEHRVIPVRQERLSLTFRSVNAGGRI